MNISVPLIASWEQVASLRAAEPKAGDEIKSKNMSGGKSQHTRKHPEPLLPAQVALGLRGQERDNCSSSRPSLSSAALIWFSGQWPWSLGPNLADL